MIPLFCRVAHRGPVVTPGVGSVMTGIVPLFYQLKNRRKVVPGSPGRELSAIIPCGRSYGDPAEYAGLDWNVW